MIILIAFVGYFLLAYMIYRLKNTIQQHYQQLTRDHEIFKLQILSMINQPCLLNRVAQLEVKIKDLQLNARQNNEILQQLNEDKLANLAI